MNSFKAHKANRIMRKWFAWGSLATLRVIQGFLGGVSKKEYYGFSVVSVDEVDFERGTNMTPCPQPRVGCHD